MKTIALLITSLLTLSAYTQSFSKIKEVSKIDSKTLKEKGFIKNNNVWENSETSEKVFLSENEIQYSFSDFVVKNSLGVSKNQKGKFVSQIHNRPGWYTDKIEVVDHGEVEAEFCKVSKKTCILFYDSSTEKTIITIRL